MILSRGWEDGRPQSWPRALGCSGRLGEKHLPDAGVWTEGPRMVTHCDTPSAVWDLQDAGVQAEGPRMSHTVALPVQCGAQPSDFLRFPDQVSKWGGT